MRVTGAMRGTFRRLTATAVVAAGVLAGLSAARVSEAAGGRGRAGRTRRSASEVIEQRLLNVYERHRSGKTITYGGVRVTNFWDFMEEQVGIYKSALQGEGLEGAEVEEKVKSLRRALGMVPLSQLREEACAAQPHPLEIWREEGLARPPRSGEGVTWWYNRSGGKQYLVWTTGYNHWRYHVVRARMKDRKERPLSLTVRFYLTRKVGADELAYHQRLYQEQGFAARVVNRDDEGYSEPPDYVIEYQWQELRQPNGRLALKQGYAKALRLLSGGGKLLFTVPNHKWVSSTVDRFFTAKLMKGELDIKSEKYDLLLDAVSRKEIGQEEEALALIGRALEADRKLVTAYELRRWLHEEARRWDDAIRDAGELILLSRGEDRAKAFVARGKLHYGIGNFDAALEDCESALKLDPKSAAALAVRGWALFHKGELGEARDAFEFALAHDARFASAIRGRGWVFVRERKYEEAIKEFDRSLGMQKNHWNALRGRGYAYKMLAEREKADAGVADEPVPFAGEKYVPPGKRARDDLMKALEGMKHQGMPLYGKQLEETKAWLKELEEL